MSRLGYRLRSQGLRPCHGSRQLFRRRRGPRPYPVGRFQADFAPGGSPRRPPARAQHPPPRAHAGRRNVACARAAYRRRDRRGGSRSHARARGAARPVTHQFRHRLRPAPAHARAGRFSRPLSGNQRRTVDHRPAGRPDRRAGRHRGALGAYSGGAVRAAQDRRSAARDLRLARLSEAARHAAHGGRS